MFLLCFTCGQPVYRNAVRHLIPANFEVEELHVYSHAGECERRLPRLLAEELVARRQAKEILR
jgi:hypothetical protein